jgi:hypothetical protein
VGGLRPSSTALVTPHRTGLLLTPHRPYLLEIQGDGHLVVLVAVAQTRTLPPAVSPVDGVRDRVAVVARSTGRHTEMVESRVVPELFQKCGMILICPASDELPCKR